MGILAWIVVGAIAGWLATMVMGGNEGILGTIILGMVGAVVGGFLAGAFFNVKDPTGINVETVVVAMIGAIIVIWIVRLLRGSGSRRGSL